MSFLGNLIWLVFGGLVIALEYFISSIILCITIIGIPFGLQTLKLAELSLWPFGKKIRQKKGAVGCLSTLMNILWLLCGGIWICASHFIFGTLLCITIIGIPFGMQHFRLVKLALTPFGREIIDK